jgi:hypothetical protein
MTIERIKELLLKVVDPTSGSMDERKVNAVSAAEAIVDGLKNNTLDIVRRTAGAASSAWNAIGKPCLYPFRCVSCRNNFPAGTEGAMMKNRAGRSALYRCARCSR